MDDDDDDTNFFDFVIEQGLWSNLTIQKGLQSNLCDATIDS